MKNLGPSKRRPINKKNGDRELELPAAVFVNGFKDYLLFQGPGALLFEECCWLPLEWLLLWLEGAENWP